MLTNIVDYDYYMDIFEGSSIPESSFNKYSIKANSKVNNYTSNRINSSNLTENIKNTICEIAEVLYRQDLLILELESVEKKEIASETVGPHSISYVSKTSTLNQRVLNDSDLEHKCYEICYNNLACTGLLYRGK